MSTPPHATPPQPIWPKPYLLELYAQAVAQGCIRVGPLPEEAAHSLTQSFYRLRRRADKNTAAFLIPEYQLVLVTPWQPSAEASPLGHIYIIFNAVPADVPALPAFSKADPAEILEAPGLEISSQPMSQLPLPDVDTSAIDVNDFLKGLREAAAQREEDQS